jgi:hypothetical protein
LKRGDIMPKFNDPGFDRLTGIRSILAERWNAQNGVMISSSAGRIARMAYQKASEKTVSGLMTTYVSANRGSTASLRMSMAASEGLNNTALSVVDALNCWDDRSRELVTVVGPNNPYTRKSAIRRWQADFRFQDFGHRERSGLAAPFATEPLVLKLPERDELLVEGLRLDVAQPIFTDSRTKTTITFNGGEAVYGVEPDGLIVHGMPFGFEPGQGTVAFDQDEAAASLGGMLRHLEDRVRTETAR